MRESMDINMQYDSNITICQCGSEKCVPGHSYGPAVRDHYLMHFIKSGKGKFSFNNETYHITQNQVFLICPGDVTYYEADNTDPWDYIWVGFNGIKALSYIKQLGLDKYHPVIEMQHSEFIFHCLQEMLEASKATRSREVKMLGYLYLMLSSLIEESTSITSQSYKDEYIEKAVQYIEMNYHRNLSITDISSYLGLNRSYFSSFFKETQGVSPQQFLIQFRIAKACEFMKSNINLSIGDISRSVGYTDPLVFSKMFKKTKGISPSAYMFREMS